MFVRNILLIKSTVMSCTRYAYNYIIGCFLHKTGIMILKNRVMTYFSRTFVNYKEIIDQCYSEREEWRGGCV